MTENLYIIVVKRGNVEIAFPFTALGLADSTALELAWDAVKTFGQIQTDAPPGKVEKPLDPKSHAPLQLFLPSRDSPLFPDISLKPQLEGQWRTAEPLPREAQVDLPEAFNAPWLYLELREGMPSGTIFL